MGKYTKEQIKAANEVSLLDFAFDQGVQLKRVGLDSYKGVDHDSLVITPSKNKFFWNSRQVGGTGALDFAEKYLLEDESDDKQIFKKAMEMVINSSASAFVPKNVERKAFKFDDKQVSQDFRQAYAYLTKTRKIDPEIVKKLHNEHLIEQNQYGDALFLMRDPNTQEIKGATIQGTKINHEKYGKRGTLKKIEADTTPNYGFNFTIGKPENLYFFEATIDAISYYNLHPNLKNAQFISMEGLKKKTFANFFNLAEEKLKAEGKGVQSVTFGVDNDEAGTNFMKTFISKENPRHYAELKNNLDEDILLRRSSPKKEFGKDWNDVLKKVKSETPLEKLAKNYKSIPYHMPHNFELNQEFIQKQTIQTLNRLVEDYNLNDKNNPNVGGKQVKNALIKHNGQEYKPDLACIYTSPSNRQIIGGFYLDSNSLLNEVEGAIINEPIYSDNMKDIAKEKLNSVLAQKLASDLKQPRLGTAYKGMQVSNSESKRAFSSLKAASEEISEFEKTPDLSRMHSAIKFANKMNQQVSKNLALEDRNGEKFVTFTVDQKGQSQAYRINTKFFQNKDSKKMINILATSLANVNKKPAPTKSKASSQHQSMTNEAPTMTI